MFIEVQEGRRTVVVNTDHVAVIRPCGEDGQYVLMSNGEKVHVSDEDADKIRNSGQPPKKSAGRERPKL